MSVWIFIISGCSRLASSLQTYIFAFGICFVVILTVIFSHEANSNDKPENLLNVGFVASVASMMLAK